MISDFLISDLVISDLGGCGYERSGLYLRDRATLPKLVLSVIYNGANKYYSLHWQDKKNLRNQREIKAGA